MFMMVSEFLPERNIEVILQYTKKGKLAATCTEENRWIDTRNNRDITDSLKFDAVWCNFYI